MVTCSLFRSRFRFSQSASDAYCVEANGKLFSRVNPALEHLHPFAASPATVKLYPHCKKCSGKQGQTLGGALSSGGAQARKDAAKAGKASMDANAGKPSVGSKTKKKK